MKLCSFYKKCGNPEENVGMITGEVVVNLTQVLQRVKGGRGPTSMLDFLDNWDSFITLARDLLTSPNQLKEVVDQSAIKLSEVRLLAPIPRPRKIVATLVNTRGMLGGTNLAELSHPRFFMKAPSTVVGPNDPIIVPQQSARPEIELAVVMAKRVRNSSMEESEKAVAGYTILNDVTAPVEGKEDTYEAYRRDRTTGEVQKVRQRAIFRSKNHDTFTPMGPCIVTRDEMESVDDLRMVTRYDGEVFQQGSTAEYTFKPAEIISFISRFLTLEPGDIVSAGSIGWVKSRLGEVDPSEWVLPSLKGTLELEIEGIGVLRNPVKPEHGG